MVDLVIVRPLNFIIVIANFGSLLYSK